MGIDITCLTHKGDISQSEMKRGLIGSSRLRFKPPRPKQCSRHRHQGTNTDLSLISWHMNAIAMPKHCMSITVTITHGSSWHGCLGSFDQIAKTRTTGPGLYPELIVSPLPRCDSMHYRICLNRNFDNWTSSATRR